MLMLSKILPLFFLPVGFCLLCFISGLMLRKYLLIWIGVLVLWLFSLPVVSDPLIRFVEGRGGRVSIGSVHNADAIVVLSGMIREVDGAPLGEWNDAADRYESGIGLFFAAKAPRLVFTGGQMPWQPEMVPEGALLARRAMNAGIPSGSILLSSRVANTAQEARAVGALLLHDQPAPLKRIILVTSAYHMSRAASLFERAGFDVERFPVDFQTSRGGRLTVLNFLPDAQALNISSIALHELLGRIFYSSAG
jgi:uncharacterized SAM-binding protein YcdF (DUF218 family)